MTAGGRGTRGGGTGRGGGSNSRSSSTAQSQTGKSPNANKKERSGLSDYVYYIGSAKKASDFTVITNYLLMHVRKTFQEGQFIRRDGDLNAFGCQQSNANPSTVHQHRRNGAGKGKQTV